MLAGTLALVLAVPGNSSAATLAQVRRQLQAWHLRPPPLFPSRLPASFRGASITLYHDLDFSVEFSRDCSGTSLCVAFKRTGATLVSVLNDKANISLRHLRIGKRSVYLIETSSAGAPAMLAWREQGRTYLLQEKYVDGPTALRVLRPLLQTLRPLPA